MSLKKVCFFNPYKSSAAFHIETSHSIYSGNQIAGFYMKFTLDRNIKSTTTDVHHTTFTSFTAYLNMLSRNISKSSIFCSHEEILNKTCRVICFDRLSVCRPATFKKDSYFSRMFFKAFFRLIGITLY